MILNSLKARNGGFFYNSNKLYRVNQVHGLFHYGRSFEVNEVIELNTKNYREKKVQSIRPKFKKKITGTHHFNRNENIAVIDFSRQKRLSQIN